MRWPWRQDVVVPDASKVEFHEAGTRRPSWMPEPTGGGRRPDVPPAPYETRLERELALSAERQAYIARRDRLHGAWHAAIEATERIRRELIVALARQAEAERAVREAQAEHDATVLGAERWLRSTAPDLIDQVVTWLLDQLEGVRRQGVLQITEREGPLNPVTLTRRRQVYSNADQIERRRLAIAEAMATWEAYRLQAIEPGELQARAEALPASLPVVDGTIEAPMTPLVTPGELREIQWRQKEAR